MEAELHQISGEIHDNEMRLKAENHARATDCEEGREFEHEEMVTASRDQTNLHEELSRATAALSSLTYRHEELEDQNKHDEEDLLDAKTRCFQDVHRTLSSTICGLTKVRDSLWLLAGAQELPVDCEVTDWLYHACSVTCGMGTRTSTREVIVENQSGIGCPPLEMVQECEEMACPTDCTLSEWSGWSKCSAVCDGGVQERTRAALTEARNGGDACPQLVETQVCNQPSCDRDCHMDEWSEWSACSKMCGGGSQRRQREVIEPATGGGECSEGLETQTCNPGECSRPNATRPAYTCAGFVEDIVLVVDSSGAVNQTEFEKLQELAAAVLQGYAPSASAAHVAVLAMGATASRAAGLEADEDTIAASISGLARLEGASMLSSSLALAGTVLRQDGRRGALATVVVLAEGMVADPYEAEQARRQLERRGARVVLAVVGSEEVNPTLLARFASEPASENLIYVPLNSTTDMTDAANTVVAKTCSGMQN